MATEHKFHDLVSLRRSLEDRLRRLEDDLKRMTGDIHAQVEKRKSLARTLELGRRLLDMYEQVRDSPHWEKVAPSSEAGDAAEQTGKPAAGHAPPFLQTGLLAIGEEHLLRFEQNHSQYSLRITRALPAAEDDEEAEAQPGPTFLSFCGGAGNILFAIDLVEEPTPVGAIYRTTDIKAFVPSNWVKDFIELSEQVAALKKELELRKRYDPAELDKLKKHFGL